MNSTDNTVLLTVLLAKHITTEKSYLRSSSISNPISSFSTALNINKNYLMIGSNQPNLTSLPNNCNLKSATSSSTSRNSLK